MLVHDVSPGRRYRRLGQTQQYAVGLGIDRTMPQLDVTCFHIARMRHSISKMKLDFSQLQLDVSPQPD
ncbi:BZ3500_MvSof-1268-A1-R1_Chr2-3g05409 [Microbotryum saponariae]|uniref:BZ3500_MvSof-1268-A1-R1_Chr2-3g05409 protein n=1 Tax=Microbotryum saponariae TaxID=289078 RepID=A0A2X0KPC9_9BASI|nr:BZ3500_MvSof-1268-A1-R1_Chr2-3g05409 [Microbotryum saponariae]SDA01391.1 BZ3501_MvSof-1269-A2-R1_Chr2-2g05082 [Microbotryum saponariae]